MSYKMFISSLLLLACSWPLASQPYQRSRELSRSFPASASATIQIDNKYGNIHLIPWQKDSVRFEISCKIRGTKPIKVDRMFQDVDFDFTANRFYVIGRTVFSNSMNSLWSEITDLTNALLSTDNRISIDYTVYYPAKSPLRINLKFGNLYATDVEGKADIKISNGDLKAHDFLGSLSLNHQFGNAHLGKIGQGQLNLGYGEFELNETEQVEIIGRSAQIRIAKAGKVQLDSRRDRLRIDHCESVSGTTSFSYITIERLSNDAVLRSNYGDIKINSLDPGFRMVDLQADYTDIGIYYREPSSFSYEFIRSEKTRVSLPHSILSKNEQIENASLKTYVRSGYIGLDSSPSSSIRIRITGGVMGVLQK